MKTQNSWKDACTLTDANQSISKEFK